MHVSIKWLWYRYWQVLKSPPSGTRWISSEVQKFGHADMELLNHEWFSRTTSICLYRHSLFMYGLFPVSNNKMVVMIILTSILLCTYYSSQDLSLRTCGTEITWLLQIGKQCAIFPRKIRKSQWIYTTSQLKKRTSQLEQEAHGPHRSPE
jgi:hypothetical protein